MKKTIILAREIEVLVVSFGGVGTTYLMNEIGKYKKTNDPSNEDGYKHLPIPPISLKPNLKVIYLFGDPILSCISLFRRQYHHTMSIRSQQYLPQEYILPMELSLEEYSLAQREGLFLARHFEHWWSRYPLYDCLFIRYEKLHDHLDHIADFLQLPPAFVTQFPPRKSRQSNFEDLDGQTLSGLEQLYGDFRSELAELPDVSHRPGKRSFERLQVFLSPAYRQAILAAMLKKIPMVRKAFHRATTWVSRPDESL